MLGLIALLGCQAGTDDAPRTVVWVVASGLRADGLTDPDLDLPHIQGLRDEAMDMRRTHAASSWPLPSFATLVTGEQPWEHRVVRDVLTGGRHGRVSPFDRTVFERETQRRTAAWTSGPDIAPVFGLTRGADHAVHDERRPAHLWPDSADLVAQALGWLGQDDEPAFVLLHLPELEFNFEPDGACRGRWTQDLDAPFELPIPEDVWRRWNARMTPHVPSEVAYARALYREDLCALDLHVGALIEGLQDLDRWNDTQLLLTSDHGDELWDYSTYGHGQGIQSVLTHVPFVLRDPAIEPGSSSTIAGHAELVSGLMRREGPGWDLVRAGTTERGRKAFSSSPSRTLDTLSWVDEELRAELRVEPRTMVIWDVDERGWETSVARTYNTEWQTLAAPELTPLLAVHPDAMDPVLPQRPWIVDR